MAINFKDKVNYFFQEETEKSDSATSDDLHRCKLKCGRCPENTLITYSRCVELVGV